MDPSSPGDLQKLREAIRHSQNELEPFRQQYRERLVQYAGDGYGDKRDAVDSPFNVYNPALRIYKRRLFSGQMRVLVTSRSPSERRSAWELGLAGDDVIRKIKLDATFDKVLQQALLLQRLHLRRIRRHRKNEVGLGACQRTGLRSGLGRRGRGPQRHAGGTGGRRPARAHAPAPDGRQRLESRHHQRSRPHDPTGRSHVARRPRQAPRQDGRRVHHEQPPPPD